MAHQSQEQSLREELTCAICFDLFRNPVMLDCMHHFCKECIQRYWDSCSEVATCPQCRRKFPSRSFRPQYLVSGVVETVRRCTSEEHRRKMQKHLQEALQSYKMEHKNLLRMKHVAKENICSLLKTSGELNAKIRAAFQHLHRTLEEEERTVLMDLARVKDKWLMKLERDSARLAEGVSELKKRMEHTQQALDKLGSSLLLEVENVAVRPAVQVGSLTTFSVQQYQDLYEGPLQYIFWRRMLKSISPAPAALTLDPDSAHPNLVLSEDLTAVTEREVPQSVTRSPRRFLQSVNVLAKESFDSGRHYWEVWVGNKTKWDLGVAAHSVDRAAKVKLCPDNGYWALRLREKSQYWAAATPWVRLKPQSLLRKVGVLLDCGARKVAFYNAEDMSHLFTFHQARARKFYPFFSTCFSDGNKNAEPMRICHLNM
ncbi:Zinc-binding protein A33 [Varanus komodoensis]|uniref:Zinc-binding protein A33-like n=1 Tax=Varanus komodoensis TaxID=61221 RepID=A0A8D2KT92_VARKO|nr:zinc-binding protein A33-like [Varanus komodoensis]KAF7249252.1 Zinc-binding protein A33 [Varanus komodoensis]